MIFKNQELLFFSLNDLTAKAFELYVSVSQIENNEFSQFTLIRNEHDGNKAKLFNHFNELFPLLDNLDLVRLANLIIVIDTYSLPNPEHNSVSEKIKSKIKELFIRYPEVKIVFFDKDSIIDLYLDDISSFNDLYSNIIRCSGIKENNKCVRKNCSDGSGVDCSLKIKSLHKFNPFQKIEILKSEGQEDDKNGTTSISAFDYLVRGQSNIYDASNIRNSIKQWFYSEIGVKANYRRAQCSRVSHLALSVEEEIWQSYFNGYALYSLGYRVLPVVSCLELRRIVAKCDPKKDSIDLVVRDYDLQFEDYQNVKYNLQRLRGLKNPPKELQEEKLKWYSLLISKFKKGFGRNRELDKEKKWKLAKGVWDKLLEKHTNAKISFITRLDTTFNKSYPCLNNSYFKKIYNKSNTSKDKKLNEEEQKAIRAGMAITESNHAILRGITKPINGIFAMLAIDEAISEVYELSIDTDYMNTDRDEERGHSIPPVILHIAEVLLNRSKEYYKKKMFMLSALLAKETMEVLNGFHFMMMLESLYWLTLAETNLIISTLGIDEKAIEINTLKRLKNVKTQVKRITKNNSHARSNVLHQIFNDVRQACYEKELYLAADVALNELVNVREGLNLTVPDKFI